MPFLSDFEIRLGETLERLRVAAGLLVLGWIDTMRDVAHDHACFATCFGQREVRIRTERQPAKPIVHAVPDDGRLLAAVRYAHAKATHRGIPVVELPLFHRRRWQCGDASIGQSN